MRIRTEYLVNKTHSHRSRQAAAPHPHTSRQVGDFSSLRKYFIMKESIDPPGRTVLHNMLINVLLTHRACRYSIHVHI